MEPFRLSRRDSLHTDSAEDIGGEGWEELGFSGYCDAGAGARERGPNLGCSVIEVCGIPPELDRYGRAGE